MPTLNEYSPDNSKEGYYVRANVGGGHPVTLQVTIVASRIFNALGYTDGDAVPTKLVWSMYELDMLYTLTSFDIDATPADVDPTVVLKELDLNNKLSDEEQAEIISYLEAYDGPDAEQVQQLREQLLEGLPEDALEATGSDTGSWFPMFNQLPQTRDEVANLLYEWSDPSMLRRSHRALLLNEKFVTWSVRTFATHQYLHQNPIVSIENNEITYRLVPPKGNKKLTIADCRGHSKEAETERGPNSEYDYRIHRVLKDGTVEEAYFREDIVIKYNSYGGESGSVSLLKYNIEDILPPQYSYFGGSNDEPYTADLLIDEYLTESLSTIQFEGNQTDQSQSDTDSESDDNPESADNSELDDMELRQVISDIPRAELLTVEGVSNNENLKAEIDGKLVVVTADLDGVEGDKIIVRLPTAHIEHDVTVDAALKVSDIPSENTTEWIVSNL